MCNSYDNITEVKSARNGKDIVRVDADTSYGHDSYTRVTVKSPGGYGGAESLELDREGLVSLRDSLTAILAAQDVSESFYGAVTASLPTDSLAYVRETNLPALVAQVDRVMGAAA